MKFKTRQLFHPKPRGSFVVQLNQISQDQIQGNHERIFFPPQMKLKIVLNGRINTMSKLPPFCGFGHVLYISIANDFCVILGFSYSGCPVVTSCDLRTSLLFPPPPPRLPPSNSLLLLAAEICKCNCAFLQCFLLHLESLNWCKSRC